MNIVEIAAGSQDLEILVRALSAAGLVETIEDSTDITVFAPTDAAFGQTAVDLGFTGDVTDENAVFDFIVAALTGLAEDGDPIPLLTSILTYHVSPGVQNAAAVTAATSIATLQGGEITPDVPVLGDLEPDLLNPALSSTDIVADNGIVHLIDRVLLPLDVPGNDVPTIAGLLAASGGDLDDNPDDFDLLAASIEVAGLTSVFDTADLDVTVFAPTDAAFISLAESLGLPAGDEISALGFIVAALTDLGGGDPLPLLTEILTYHVAPGTLQSQQVLATTQIATLQGGEITLAGTTLVDAETALPDPNLVLTALDGLTSNGIVHGIDQVLIPFDLPSEAGAIVQIGTDGRDRLEGGDAGDLIVQKGLGDLLIGAGGADTFLMSDSGVRSKIIDFEQGSDLIDISAWGVSSLDGLNIVQRGEGSVLIGAGSNGAVVQSATGAISVADLGADSFVFAPPAQGQIITGTDGRDRLEGTAGDDLIVGGLGRDFLTGSGGNDVFVAGADTFDVILDFTENQDVIDLTEWRDTILTVTGVSDAQAVFSGLDFLQLKAGLVEISFAGAPGAPTENVRVQAADREITQADFDADDFIF